MAIIVFLIFAAMFIVIWAFARLISPAKTPVDRLENWMTQTQQEVIHDAKEHHKQTWIQFLGSLFEKTGVGKPINERTKMELIRADIPLTGYEFNVTRVLFAIALSLLTYGVVQKLWVLPVVFIIVWLIPMQIVKNKKAARYKLFSTQLGDALSILSNSLRAGFSFMQAINSVAKEMPDPVGKEFMRLTKEMSLGLSTDESLENLLKRVQIDDLDLLVTAIMIQKEIGGNLAEILDSIGVTIRERIKIKNEVKTLTAQGKLSGIIIASIPVVLGLFLLLLNPEYIKLLFTHPIGRIMLGLAISNEIIGAFMIRKIISIDV